MLCFRRCSFLDPCWSGVSSPRGLGKYPTSINHRSDALRQGGGTRLHHVLLQSKSPQRLTSPQCWEDMGRSYSTSGRFGSKSRTLWLGFDQPSQISAEFGPTSARIRPTLAELGRSWPALCKAWPARPPASETAALPKRLRTDFFGGVTARAWEVMGSARGPLESTGMSRAGGGRSESRAERVARSARLGSGDLGPAIPDQLLPPSRTWPRPDPLTWPHPTQTLSTPPNLWPSTRRVLSIPAPMYQAMP